MFGNQFSRESGKSDEMTPSNSAEEGRWNRAAKSNMMINSEFLFGFVKTKDAVGLMSRSARCSGR